MYERTKSSKLIFPLLLSFVILESFYAGLVKVEVVIIGWREERKEDRRTFLGLWWSNNDDDDDLE